jgi:hypothetical protein
MIKFRCALCEQKIGVPDEHAGKQVKCPGCGQPVQVPGGVADEGHGLDDVFSSLADAESVDGPTPPAFGTVDHHQGPSQVPVKLIALLGGGGGLVAALIVVAIVLLGGPSDRPERDADRSTTNGPVAQAPTPEPQPQPQPQQPETASEPTDDSPGPDSVDDTAGQPDEPPVPPEVVVVQPEPVDDTPPPKPEEPATQPTSDDAEAIDPSAEAVAWFDRQYGPRFAEALATANFDDNAALIEKLNGALTAEADRIERSAVLCEKLFALARESAAGFATAELAMLRLGDLQPRRRAEALGELVSYADGLLESGTEPTEQLNYPHVVALYLKYGDALLEDLQPGKALEAYQLAYDRGREYRGAPFPAIIKRREKAEAALARQQEVDGLIAKLAADPGDEATAKRLADIFLFEYDRPERAKAYIERVGDEATQAKLTLVLGEFETLTIAQCLELAEWYRLRGEAEGAVNPVAMYIRAKAYYERYLTLHLTQDEQRIDVIRTKWQVDRTLSRLGVGMKKARRLVRAVRGGGAIDPRIEQAIARGVQWLYANQDIETYWESDTKTADRDYGGSTAVVCYAMTMAGEDPQSNPQLRRAIDWVFKLPMKGTYSVCFRAHLWETLEANAVADNVMRRDARRMVRGGFQDGTHGYIIEPQKSVGDMSTTLAAYLTYWLGEIGGIESATDMHWSQMCYTLIKRQNEDGSWAYRPDREANLAMTAAAMTILLMAKNEDHFIDEFAEYRRDFDAALDKGFYWLSANYKADPGGKWPNYALAAVQHVGLLAERKHFGDQDWYGQAAEALIRSQAEDGSWPVGEGRAKITNTAFAVIFLARGGMEYDVIPPKDKPEPTAKDAAALPMQPTPGPALAPGGVPNTGSGQSARKAKQTITETLDPLTR